MYDYRRMSPEQQKVIVADRRERNHPWHSPPHLAGSEGFRIVTGACYEHQKLLSSAERLEWFEQRLLQAIEKLGARCAAWCVLPNHYHVLVEMRHIREFSVGLGRLHGRTSFEMNQADQMGGRKVWYRCMDRAMRSERHFYVSLNYIHNNAVKHGYVKKWQEWPYSSVHWYLQSKGRDWLLELWREYPVLNYGDDWNVF
jgi:putative transposase